MLVFLPPAQAQFSAMAHVETELSKARKAAKAGHRPLCLIITADAFGLKEVMSFLESLEGAKQRSEMEFCILDPGSLDARHFIEQQELHELPAMFLFRTHPYEVPNAARRGQDALQVGKAVAFLSNLKFGDPIIGTKPSPAELKAHHPDIADPELFIKYTENLDRVKPEFAVVKPYRSMLSSLLNSTDSALRGFAAARLLEANAPLLPNEPNPFTIVLKSQSDLMLDGLRGQNKPAPFNGDYIEWRIQALQDVHPTSPFWPALKAQLTASPMAINVGLYAMLAPMLATEDKPWVLACFKVGAIQAQNTGPWENTSFWLAVDWLLCFGEPSDWQQFASVLDPKKGWAEGLEGLRVRMQAIPAYWNVSPHVQGIFCEGSNEDSFWKAPDACLAEWGVTRESLIKLSMSDVHEKRRSTLRYPDEARKRHFSASMRVQILIGPDGEVKAARPFPGHALAFFAPEALRFSAASTFDPAVVAGVKRPSRFFYNLLFNRP